MILVSMAVRSQDLRAAQWSTAASEGRDQSRVCRQVHIPATAHLLVGETVCFFGWIYLVLVSSPPMESSMRLSSQIDFKPFAVPGCQSACLDFG